MKAKENKVVSLAAQLAKLINENGKFIDKLYESFKTDDAGELKYSLNQVMENKGCMTTSFEELTSLDEENETNIHTFASYTEHMDEIRIVVEIASARLLELEEMENEEKRIEEERAEKEREILEQRKIFERQKAKREEERTRILERMRIRKENTQSGTLQHQASPLSANSQPPQLPQTPRNTQLSAPTTDNGNQKRNQPVTATSSYRAAIPYSTAYNRGSSPSSHAESESSIMQLAGCIAQSIKQTKRTILEPKIFTGDPLHFADWEQDFDDFMDSQGVTDDAKRVRYLKNYLDKDAREVVQGQLTINTAESYQHIRSKLRDRFGRKLNVARAIKEKLDAWPVIKTGDSRGLQKYADYLDNIRANLSSNENLCVLHNDQENERLVDKLPEWMARKWAAKLRQTQHFMNSLAL